MMTLGMDERRGQVPKNIVIFSDGTGQAGGLHPGHDTNVWKLYAACPVIPGAQETFYDPGLGSPVDGSDWGRWRRVYNLFSRATGLGVSRNIEDCYAALIRLYEPGDRIFLFGFSRGAYTVRSLAGVLGLCGLPTSSFHGHDLRARPDLHRQLARAAVMYVYQCYGDERRRLQRAEKFRRHHHCCEVVPHFIGVWDTVRAVGLPGVHHFFRWRHEFHDCALDQRVRHARHALSIDENRAVFEPEIWDEADDDRANGRIKQMWFPGVHSDVGGGYSESQLSDLTLDWMVGEATAIAEPLIVDRAKLALAPSYLGLQHDERRGLGRLFVPGNRAPIRPEWLEERAVSQRIAVERVPTVRGEHPYRPVGLANHPEFKEYYQAVQAQRRAFHRWLFWRSLPALRGFRRARQAMEQNVRRASDSI